MTVQEVFPKEKLLKDCPVLVKKVKLLRKTHVPSLPINKELRHSVYNPTKIWATRYSEFWQWQRVSEWHREYGQDEIINEKRHILL